MTPDVRVVRGEPDDIELAALVAGLSAGNGHRDDTAMTEAGRARTEATARRRWRDAAVGLADPLTPGPDAWRWSTQARSARV
ncbi:acyl-CoA carboxylase subunit epsilon [Cellulomonas sp. KRMCY2]|uniref:acyl-CoA carboxylase subunit epsilon n=1 Tax=Cellulomonas sp. KRMCY2 TaxID=1304865 RepID=UPI00045EA494|nr:acyl-CoA carboxylase subunit epsilon [Cellulomonas sp. KRMCY2]